VVSSLDLHTTGNMEAAVMHYTPPEASGHPAEFMLDNNLDTYWKSTSTATVALSIDLTKTKTVGCLLLFFKNYKEISAGTLQCWWSDNGSTWYVVSGTTNLTDTSTPIRIRTTGLGLTHRYWRATIVNPSHVVELAGIWFGSYYNVAQGNVLPQMDEDQFYNRVSQLPGGRVAVTGINRNHTENPSRRYLVKTGTPYSNMLSAFQDSRGIRHLLIVNEGATQGDARIVRFADDVMPRPIVGYDGLYEIEIGLRGVPYVDNGDTF